MPRGFPEAAPELTHDWLTQTLRDSGVVRDAIVAAHSWEAAPVQGATSTVVSVSLTYDREQPDAPQRVVAKFASPHQHMRQRLHELGAFTQEIEFYRAFGDDPGIPIPDCFFAQIDAATGVFVLLLEDMSDSRAGDFRTRSASDVEIAVQHLATFHARWWRSPQLRSRDFLRFPGSETDRAAAAAAQARLAATMPEVRKRFAGRHFEILLAIGERTASLPDFGWQAAEAGSGSGDQARIIVHGLETPRSRALRHETDQPLSLASDRSGRRRL